MAAVDYFLKIDAISGESTDAKHKGEIEVESFSWGLTRTALAGAGGPGAGRAQFQDLAFTTRVSTASPSLFQKCATGEHIKQAVLTARTQDAKGQPQEFIKLTLSDVLVSSYQSSVEKQPGPVQLATGANVVAPVDTVGRGQLDPTDSTTLRYASVTYTQGPPSRTSVQPSVGGTLRFDPKTNTVTAYPPDPGAPALMTVGTVDGGIQRAVREYDVRILIGLLRAPFSTAHLRLGVNELREPAINPNATIASATASREDEDPSPHLFDVILYTPADGTLDASDLTRGGKKVGRIAVDPNADPASATIDLTELVRRRGLETFGIRLQQHGLDLPEPFEGDHDDDEHGLRSHSADDDHDDDHDDDEHAPFAATFSLDLVLDNQ